MSEDHNRPRPSTKHTLEEVLQTLQDLVRNELADPAQVSKEPRRGATSPAHTPSTAARPPVPPAQEQKPAASTAMRDDPAPAAEPPVLTDVVIPGVSRNAKRAGARRGPGAPEQTSINWDDIPVLNEVVQPPPVTRAADKAQRIAAAVISAIVAELGKAGQPPLDPVIISRLEAAVREVLKGLVEQPPTHKSV